MISPYLRRRVRAIHELSLKAEASDNFPTPDHATGHVASHSNHGAALIAPGARDDRMSREGPGA